MVKGPETRKARFALRMPPSLRKGIDEAARRDQRSVSDWAVLALAAAVRSGQPPEPIETPPEFSNLTEDESRHLRIALETLRRLEAEKPEKIDVAKTLGLPEAEVRRLRKARSKR